MIRKQIPSTPPLRCGDVLTSSNTRNTHYVLLGSFPTSLPPNAFEDRTGVPHHFISLRLKNATSSVWFCPNCAPLGSALTCSRDPLKQRLYTVKIPSSLPARDVCYQTITLYHNFTPQIRRVGPPNELLEAFSTLKMESMQRLTKGYVTKNVSLPGTIATLQDWILWARENYKPKGTP